MEYRELFQNWDIRLERLHPELTPEGSPNRSVRRLVFETSGGELLVAEGFDLRKKRKQILQNELLEYLQTADVPGGFPYLRCADNAHGVNADGCFWQLRPWISGDKLPRERLGDDKIYADIWGDFLLKLNTAINDRAGVMQLPNERFYFAGFLDDLKIFMERQMPDLSAELALISGALQNFLDVEKLLPCAFAHGDFHPGNILLRDGRIAAVIDWEFAGMKCAGYDLVLLLGCLGRDEPAWLDGGVTKTLQHRLYNAGYMPDAAWEHLIELMAAVRLGWLGEWINLNDRRLAAGELAYIRMLLDI